METDLSLLRRVQASQVHAWERLVELYSPLVSQWCRRAGLADDAVEDVHQEVFLTVWRSVARFERGPRGSFCGWLLTITRSRIIDHHRRASRQVDSLGGTDFHRRLLAASDDQLASPSDELLTPDDREQLIQRALALLEPQFSAQSWQAFLRTTLDRAPSSEVAQQLGISANAVRKAKARVLARLRLELDDLVE